ncbi:MAG TPA: hypothetical protein VIU38_08440 [Anaerolineales bacterium]
MFFQEAPPDTSAYMIAGYVIFFIISAIYLLSLVIRRRNLEADLKTLEAMQAESRPASARAAPASARKQVRKKVTRRK